MIERAYNARVDFINTILKAAFGGEDTPTDKPKSIIHQLTMIASTRKGKKHD